MDTILVKELMVPLEEYAVVPQDTTLYNAVIALGDAQQEFDPLKHKHRAILVLDNNNNVVGKLSMFDILIALEPKYRNLEEASILSHTGYSPEFLKSMIKDNALWGDPLQFICERAAQLNVSDIMEVPEDGVYIDENTALGEAIRQMVMPKRQSLLVTSGDNVVGILRLSDVFTQVCETIKTCKL